MLRSAGEDFFRNLLNLDAYAPAGASHTSRSVSFGRFSLPILQSYAMNQTFEKLESSLRYQD
jgi:hypothetical protein